MQIEQKLESLGITLPPATKPGGSYVSTVQTGNLLFVSGHASIEHRGKLGRDVTVEQGYQIAREVAISLLGTIHDALGDLDRVARIVKLLGLVNSTEHFTEQPQVINGASELFVEVFDEVGKHARSAFGVAQLPLNSAVEIELILELATPASAQEQRAALL
ncbi:MAG: RidA family protein [Ktedonobacteraceae bacterium]|nr:RidA family protein [Ktedonobacteraceae bacterium]